MILNKFEALGVWDKGSLIKGLQGKRFNAEMRNVFTELVVNLWSFHQWLPRPNPGTSLRRLISKHRH